MSPKPNVVFFFTDQQRWDTTGIHGNPLDLTPVFDRFAQRGTHCYNTFTCQPVCAPARASLQTGLYATNTGVWTNGQTLAPTQKTMANYFREAGYTTGYIGKWHLSDNDLAGPVRPEERGGYEYWLGANLLEFTSDAYDTVMFDNDMQPVKLPGYRVDAIADAAIDYINDHQQEPFFLFLSFLEPHFQNSRDDYPAPDGYAERYTGRWTPPDLDTLPGTARRHLPGYYGMVKRLDEAFGRIQDALRSLHLLENTIIVFTSDHGNHFKTRNMEYKRSCHESSIRIPLAFSGPGFSGGGRIENLVSLLDVPPTLLDACGITVPKTMQGRSILPLIRYTTEGWPEEVFVQISEAQVGRCVRTSRWKYSVYAPGKGGYEAPASDTYVEEFLYDLLADPYELENLIDHDGYGEVKQVMKERLLRRLVEAGEAAPQIEQVPLKTPRGQRVLPPNDRYL